MKSYVYTLTQFLRMGGKVLLVHAGEQGNETATEATNQHIVRHYKVGFVVSNLGADRAPETVWIPSTPCSLLDYSSPRVGLEGACARASADQVRGGVTFGDYRRESALSSKLNAWAVSALFSLNALVSEQGPMQGDTLLIVLENPLLLHQLALTIVRVADQELNQTVSSSVQVIMDRFTDPNGWLEITAGQCGVNDATSFTIDTRSFPAQLPAVEGRGLWDRLPRHWIELWHEGLWPDANRKRQAFLAQTPVPREELQPLPPDLLNDMVDASV